MSLCPQSLLTLGDGQVVAFVDAISAQEEDESGPQGNLPLPQQVKAKAVSEAVLSQDDLGPPLAARRAQIQHDLFGPRTRKKRSASESDLLQIKDSLRQNKSLIHPFFKPSNTRNKIQKKSKGTVKTGNIPGVQPKPPAGNNGNRGPVTKRGVLKRAGGENLLGGRVAAITSSLKNMEIGHENALAVSSDTSISPKQSAVGNGM